MELQGLTKLIQEGKAATKFRAFLDDYCWLLPRYTW